MTDSGVRTSIIVPSFRRADSLERLLASLLPQLADRPDRELIVVDDASNDPAYPALAARYPGQMRLVTQPKNAGQRSLPRRIVVGTRPPPPWSR